MPEPSADSSTESTPEAENKPTGPDAKPSEDQTTIAKLNAEISKLRDEAAKSRIAATEAKKTEAEKMADQLSQLQSDLAQERLGRIKATVINESGYDAKLVEPLLTATDEDGLREQLKALASFVDSSRPVGPAGKLAGTARPEPSISKDWLRDQLNKS